MEETVMDSICRRGDKEEVEWFYVHDHAREDERGDIKNIESQKTRQDDTPVEGREGHGEDLGGWFFNIAQPSMAMERVLILSGSESDKPIIKKITQVLDQFGVKYRYEVASAHRNPDKVERLVKESGADVFVGVAGVSAALPGVIAARTTKPVIGVPVNAALDGLDSLLSIVQMPPNVPVACVGIDNGKNAAVLAVEILALKDAVLEKKLKEFKESLKK